MSFFEELKRRNVVRVGVVYLIVAWLLAQVADLMLENFNAPDWVIQAILVVLIVGFPLAVVFAWAFELTPEGIKKERDVDRAQSITRHTGRKLDRTIIVVLVLALGYFIYESRFSPPPLEDNVIPDRAQRASGTQSEVIGTGADRAPGEAGAAMSASDEGGVDLPPAKSIAVLPFVNMSDDASNEYFSDGISEEILNAQAKIRELKVAGRTSSFAFKGKDQDLRQIGETLGVEHILEGSVRKAGTKVRITAQLIQVDDGFHLWSDSYDRELTDVFAIQDEIANAILAQLKARLLEDDTVIAATRTDAKAYEQYLLARQRIYERNRLSIEKATELLDSAIAIDPDYAPAHAQRGIATLLLVEDQYGTLPQEQSDPLGKQFLDQAIDLDPNLAEAWAGIGLYHINRPREHEQAIEALQKALAINPNLIDASNWLQIVFANSGRNAEVLAIVEDMVERDPLYRPGVGNAINYYNWQGRQDKALALLERIEPFIGNEPEMLSYRARIHNSLGEFDKAVPLIEEALRKRPDDGLFKSVLGFALWGTHQYEQLADLGIPFQRIYALEILGQREEATILAYEEAASGNIGALFGQLVVSGRYTDLVRFFENRWPDLDAFEADYPHDDSGHWQMMDLAFAFSQTNNGARFDDAMSRVRTAHDQLMRDGVGNGYFFFAEALYHVMTGDHDNALDQLDTAIGKGAIGDLRLARGNPALAPLEGDPRYAAIQARMIENLNARRATLGLEPATI
jgi:TolB-like protein